MSALMTSNRFTTAAELLEQLGGIAPERVLLKPLPGTATESDLIRLNIHSNRLYELVQGTLVEKVMSFPESALGVSLILRLGVFLDRNDLGLLAGADGEIRLMRGLVRIPDISFIRWERLPRREIPMEPIAGVAPNLAVEVLSKGNTLKEMARKLREYLQYGVELVWFIDPKQRTVEVFTGPEQSIVLTEADTLDGGDVLPGFSIPVRKIFAKVPRQTKAPAKSKPNHAKSNSRKRPSRS